MSNKLSIKKESEKKDTLKGPDEFQEWVAKAARFFMEYGVRIAIGAGVTIAVIVITILVSRHNRNVDQVTADNFSKAFGSVATQVLPDEQMTSFPTVDKTAVEGARKTLAEFSASKDKHAIAGLAKLGEAIAALHAGDASGAADILKPMLEGSKLDPALTSLAVPVFAIASDAAGRRDEAQIFFKRMTEDAAVMTKAYGYLYLGDMFNPNMKLSDDQPVDAAEAMKSYKAGIEALGGPDAVGETALLASSFKMRIAGLD